MPTKYLSNMFLYCAIETMFHFVLKDISLTKPYNIDDGNNNATFILLVFGGMIVPLITAFCEAEETNGKS